MDFQPGTGTIAFTASPTLANGLINGSITYNGTDWATITGGAVAAFTGYTELPASTATTTATVNYVLTAAAGATKATAESVNTLKLAPAAAGQALTLGNTLTLTGLGVLFDDSNGTTTISGGQLGIARRKRSSSPPAPIRPML